MCVGDWRFARFIRMSAKVVALSGLPTEIVTQNMQRVGLSIFPPDSIGLFDLYAVINELSVFLARIGPPISDFTAMSNVYGTLPTKSFLAADVGGATTITVVEYTLPESVLTAAMESLQREYGPNLRV